MHQIALKCCQLKKGAWVFTLTEQLPNVIPGQKFVNLDEKLKDIRNISQILGLEKKVEVENLEAPMFECV